MLNYALGNRAVFHANLLEAFGGEAGLAAALAQNWSIHPSSLLISGHYGLAHPIVVHAVRPVYIASVLRHPVERIVSLYDYIRGTPAHPEHTALREVTLNQALDTVPEFAVHCHDAQIRTLFNATDRDGIQEALRRYPFMLGRMNALEAFARRLIGSFGLALCGALPIFNERKSLPGMGLACAQADYATALARLERYNRAELDFYARLPPLLVTKPKPALLDMRVA